MPASLVQSHRGSPPPPPPPCPAPRPAHHQPTSTPSDAALAGALRRLRHVPRESIRDTSKVDLTAGPDAALVAAYQHQVLDANCEKWLPLLAEGGHTFASVFVPLTPQHAQMLMDMQAAYERTGVVQTQPPAEAETIYAELQAEVAAGMARLPTTDGRGDAQGPAPPCFAKTSSRSPKDAAVASRRLRQLYLNRLGLSDHSAAKAAKFESGSGDPDGEGSSIHPPLPIINARLVALLQAGTEMLAMADAGEVLQTMGCSERIATDMRLALEHPQRFEEHIVLRQWVPLDVGLEFRGFVCGGRLTALSQYNHLARFAHVERLYPALAIAIREFFASHIRDTLAPVLDSYVIDFAVVLKEDKDERAGAAGGEEELTDDDADVADAASADASARIAKIWVIEVNPFLETTDGALFSWQRDRDVIEGRRPFEFRQQTRQPTKATATQLQQSWRNLLLHPFA